MKLNFLSSLILFFFLSASFQTKQENLTNSSGTIDENIVDYQILNLNVQDLQKMTDNYLGMIILFTQETTNEEEQVRSHDQILQGFLHWKLNNTAYTIAKVMTKELDSIPDQLRPETLPGLIFFTEKKKIVYQGELNVEKCLTWLQRIKSRETEHLNNFVEFEEFISSDTSTKLVAFYQENMLEEIKTLQSLVSTGVFLELGIYRVGICFQDCQIAYKGLANDESSLALFRQTSGGFEAAKLENNFNNDSAILEFCIKEAIPPVVVLNEITSRFLFIGFAQLHLILVINNQTQYSSLQAQVLADFRKSADYNRKNEAYEDRVIHLIYNADAPDSSKLNKILDLNNENQIYPQLLAVNVTEKQFIKYESQDTKINYENIRKFIVQFRNHQLNKHLASEPIPPACENCTVEKIVGTTFQSKVIESSDNFIVLFCGNTPEWPECLYSFKILQYIAESLESFKSSRLKFGYINTDKNEIEFEYVNETPVIILFSKDSKKHIHELKAPHTLEKLAEWLNELMSDLNLVVEEKEVEKFEDEKLSTKEKEKYEIIKGIVQDEKKMIQEEEERIKINQENEYSFKYIDL